MVTKEQLKKEIERLPNDLLEKVHEMLKELKKSPITWKLRNFKGEFDKGDVRSEAYE